MLAVVSWDSKQIGGRGDKAAWARRASGPVTCAVDWEEMRRELCIHLVIPAAGTQTIITLWFFKGWFKESDRAKEIYLECLFLFVSLHLFKVPLYIQVRLNDVYSSLHSSLLFHGGFRVSGGLFVSNMVVKSLEESWLFKPHSVNI